MTSSFLRVRVGSGCDCSLAAGGIGVRFGLVFDSKKTAIIPNYEHTTSSDDIFGDESILASLPSLRSAIPGEG